MITKTGSSFVVPSSSGIFLGGNHRSHCAASPAVHVIRSAGSTGRCSGRSRRTLSLNHRIEPLQPTRSASTVAGICGTSASNARTCCSYSVNDVGPGDRTYRGGASEFTALLTVVLEIPNCTAMRDFGTPSAASLLINAQSSKVITLPSLSAHFSPPSAGEESDPASALDARLVSAALEALASRPAETLSLRKVAHGMGVSHQAPYVHFGSRRRFLAAVAGAGLQRAANDASAAVAAAGNDPRRRLQALAHSYLDFIRTRPHVHDLAYGPTVAKRDHPLLQNAAIAYWSLLHDTVAEWQPHGISESEVLRRSAAAWGTVSGIARLSAFHQIPQAVPTDTDRLIQTAVDALVAGWQTRPQRDGDPTT